MEVVGKAIEQAHRSDDTRAVGPDKTSLALSLENVGDADHVMLRNTFSNATIAIFSYLAFFQSGGHSPDHERNFCGDSFFYTRSCKRRSNHPLTSALASVVDNPGYAHGTKIAEAVAPASFTASATVAKTGFPRCVVPAFFGFVPPTTFVPGHYQQLVGNVGEDRIFEKRTVINCLLRVEPEGAISIKRFPECKSPGH